jgi:hypothetical protein
LVDDIGGSTWSDGFQEFMNNQRGRESLFSRAVEEDELLLGIQVGGEREANRQRMVIVI